MEPRYDTATTKYGAPCPPPSDAQSAATTWYVARDRYMAALAEQARIAQAVVEAREAEQKAWAEMERVGERVQCATSTGSAWTAAELINGRRL
jgi:hypothetical protein